MSSGPDINDKSYSQLDRFTVDNIDLSRPLDGFADRLKVSGCTNFAFQGGIVRGGAENAIDVNNHSENGLFNRMELLGGDQASIVCKGACRSIVFADILITPSPKSWCDVLWDDWSDQGQAASTGLLKNLTRTDGRPVRLVVGRGVWPAIQGGNVSKCYVYSFGLRLYNWGKGILRNLHLV